MLRTTCVATRLAGGHAYNALPQSSDGERELPHRADLETPKTVREALTRAMADTGIKITFTTGERRRIRPTSPTPDRAGSSAPTTESDEEACGATFPSSRTMSTGATDGRVPPRGGIPTYGVSGLFLVPGESNAHGRDEKMRVKSFYEGLEFLDQLVRRRAARPRFSPE